MPTPSSRALLLGAVIGLLATVTAALTSPELYIDWAALAGFLVVIPLYTLGAAALVAIPLAVTRRITWAAAVAAMLTSLVVGEIVFAASQGTAFARWSAARHWEGMERSAAAEREQTERETCRRLAESSSAGLRPGEGPSILAGPDRERCADLLGR